MWIQEDSCGGARFTWPLWMCREAAAEWLRTFFITRFTSFAGWWFQKLLPVILGISWYDNPNWLSSFSRVAKNHEPVPESSRTQSKDVQNMRLLVQDHLSSECQIAWADRLSRVHLVQLSCLTNRMSYEVSILDCMLNSLIILNPEV